MMKKTAAADAREESNKTVTTQKVEKSVIELVYFMCDLKCVL